MSILHDIFNNEYYPADPKVEMPPAIDAKWQDFLREVEEALGKSFIEKHWGNLYELQNCRDYINFREGFCLGVALMKEAL